MNKTISHQEIAQKFVDGKAFDFHNIGKIITELGPTLAVRDEGLHGVILGKHIVLACIKIGGDVGQFLGGDRESGLARTIAEDVGRPR